MRKMASVQVIWKVEPIEGADRIELGHVMGWQCVVNKDVFKPMDKGVYFEIDSYLPIDPRFEFLRAGSYKNSQIMGEGFKIKTMKFKGQISQGLFLPLSQFPEIPEDAEVGTDVTELLHVRKWEVEERATTSGTIAGTLPYDVPVTDEIRVQNFVEFPEEFKELEYYITTKMDGSSHSVSLDGDGFYVTGHHYEYKDDDSNSFYRLVKERGWREKIEAYAKEHNYMPFTLQGELCAPGIQRNRLKLIKPEWYVFTVRINGKRVGLQETVKVCKDLGMEMVPIEEIGFNFPEKYPTVESVLERADGTYPKGGPKEGIVIRPVEPVFSTVLSAALSMKAVNNRYLLKNEE